MNQPSQPSPAPGSPVAAPDFWARGGGWVLGQSALMILVLGLGPLSAGDWPRPFTQAIALGCGIIGAVFGLAGVWVLGRNRTIFPQPQPHSELIRHGIYRWVRHPLYTSVISLAVGWGLYWASGATLLATLALTVLLGCKARREEQWLVAHFPDYAAYRARVRGFVPGLF